MTFYKQNDVRMYLCIILGILMLIVVFIWGIIEGDTIMLLISYPIFFLVFVLGFRKLYRDNFYKYIEFESESVVVHWRYSKSLFTLPDNIINIDHDENNKVFTIYLNNNKCKIKISTAELTADNCDIYQYFCRLLTANNTTYHHSCPK